MNIFIHNCSNNEIVCNINNGVNELIGANDTKAFTFSPISDVIIRLSQVQSSRVDRKKLYLVVNTEYVFSFASFAEGETLNVECSYIKYNNKICYQGLFIKNQNLHQLHETHTINNKEFAENQLLKTRKKEICFESN